MQVEELNYRLELKWWTSKFHYWLKQLICGFRSNELANVPRLAVEFVTIIANERLKRWTVSCSGLFGPNSVRLRMSLLTDCGFSKKHHEQKCEAANCKSHICLRVP